MLCNNRMQFLCKFISETHASDCETNFAYLSLIVFRIFVHYLITCIYLLAQSPYLNSLRCLCLMGIYSFNLQTSHNAIQYTIRTYKLRTVIHICDWNFHRMKSRYEASRQFFSCQEISPFTVFTMQTFF